MIFDGACGLTGIVNPVTQLDNARRSTSIYAGRTTMQVCDLAFRLLQIARASLFVTPKACSR